MVGLCVCAASRLAHDVGVGVHRSKLSAAASQCSTVSADTDFDFSTCAGPDPCACVLHACVGGCTCTPLMLVVRAGQAFINKASDMQICAGAAPNSDHLCSTCWPLAQDARVLYVRYRDGMAQSVHSLATLAGGNPVRTHPVMSW